MKWLNYHHLLYFREIAKEGSIAKASAKLLVGQPALSYQLKQLEESLGVLLFERKNRALVLTEAGTIALEYAEEIFNKGEEFLQAFNSKTFLEKSRYRLGALAGLPKTLVVKVLEEVKRLEPRCFVSTYEAESDELTEKLLKHELDLVITNDPGRPVSDVYRKLAGSAPVSVYGSKKFEALQENFPDSLNEAPFILQTMHSKLRFDIEQVFMSNKIKYDLVAECQDSSVKKMLAQNHQGLIFMPEFAGAALVENE
ncbi:MAG: LysR family transcriptional regulator, partial [Bacteriovoracaceae bacterium]